MQKYLMVASLLLVCSGCDLAARQQAREEARREQSAKDLKAIGEALHKKPAEAPMSESPAAAEPKSDPVPSSESREEMK